MKNFVLLLVVAALAGCQSGASGKTGKNRFSIDSVKAHVLKMNESYGERFMTNDTAFYVARYCTDAQVYSPGMPAVEGRDSIRAFFYNNGNNKEAKIELPEGKFYGNDEMVIEDGTYSFPDGKGGVADKGKFIAIWKQEDGIWKLYREIWNSDIPPPPPPVK